MRQIFAHSVSISEQKFIIYLCVLGVCRATWVVAWDKSGKYLDWEAWKEGNIYTDLYSHDFGVMRYTVNKIQPYLHAFSNGSSERHRVTVQFRKTHTHDLVFGNQDVMWMVHRSFVLHRYAMWHLMLSSTQTDTELIPTRIVFRTHKFGVFQTFYYWFYSRHVCHFQSFEHKSPVINISNQLRMSKMVRLPLSFQFWSIRWPNGWPASNGSCPSPFEIAPVWPIRLHDTHEYISARLNSNECEENRSEKYSRSLHIAIQFWSLDGTVCIWFSIFLTRLAHTAVRIQFRAACANRCERCAWRRNNKIPSNMFVIWWIVCC